MIWRLAFSALSPAGTRGRLSTFIFHRVVPEPDPLFPGEVDAAAFGRICTWLRRWFQVLPLDDALARLRDGRLPSRAAAITFDDGYRDNHDVALPILQRHGLPATFFVATGFLDGGRMWNDTIVECIRRTSAPVLDLSGLGCDGLGTLAVETPAMRRAAIGQVLARVKYLPPEQRSRFVSAMAERSAAELPVDLMMTRAQVAALFRAGMQVGGHTVSHPILSRLADDEAAREIADGRHELQEIIGAPVHLFAYPNGVPGEDYGQRECAIVRELGFAAAVSTAWGTASKATDPYQIPRFTPWDRTPTSFALRLAANLWRPDRA